MRRFVATFAASALIFSAVMGAQISSASAENNPDTSVSARDTPKIPKSVYRIKTKDKVAFITIDDGIYKPENALAYVQANQLPVTSFLSSWTIKDSKKYFNRISKWGSVQNHSATHASFAKKSTDLDHEICYVQNDSRKSTTGTPGCYAHHMALRKIPKLFGKWVRSAGSSK